MLGRGEVGREIGREACRRGRGGLGRDGRGGTGRGPRRRRAESRDTFEAGETGYAIGALSLEAGGGGVVLVAATEGPRREVAAMAVLDSSGGERGERGGGAGGRSTGESSWGEFHFNLDERHGEVVAGEKAEREDGRTAPQTECLVESSEAGG